MAASLGMAAMVSSCSEATISSPIPVVTLVSGLLPTGVVGTPYDASLSASGGDGDFEWSLVSGSFPAGLDLSADGSLSGTPTTAGSFDATVRAASGGQSATGPVRIVVVEPLSITTTALASGIVGNDYAQVIGVEGGEGSVAFSVSEGTLPDGIALDEVSGSLSGSPTVAGAFDFGVEVTRGTQAASADFTLTVFESLSITTTTFETATVGVPYVDTVSASGGTGSYAFGVVAGALPDGLTLDSIGVISGTPAAAGASELTIRAASGDQAVTADIEVVVYQPVSITTTTLPDGVTGMAYSLDLAAAGGDGTYAWSLASGALPVGLALSGGGAITGSPSVAGTSEWTVQATSAGGDASQALSLTVWAPVVVTTTGLANGAVGDAYDQTIAASGGSGTYTFVLTEGALPDGTILDESTGRITGTPNAPGTSDFTVEATSEGLADTSDLSITIVAAGCTLSSLPDTDGDRLPDCVETNTGIYVHTTDTGTDPSVADSDEDGIPDGDEVLGTTGGLDLPAMGLNPLKKNVLIEYDWFSDSEGGGAHDHRPSAASVALVAAAFAGAPVANPDGTTGITAIQDYGQGGVFTGGSEVPDVDGCVVGGVGGGEYSGNVATHFASNRVGYFHYSLMIHQYDADGADSCAGASGSSGQAFYNDHRLIVASNWWHNGSSSGDRWVANTIVHELGHNLNLSHGGSRSAPQSALNYKPNYPSVMNYRYQFAGVDTDCDVLADGVLDYSRGTRIPLDESALDETQGVCGGTAVDWNADGDATDVGLSLDAQAWDQGAGSGEANGSVSDVLEDFDDWANIRLASSVAGSIGPLAGLVLEVAEVCTAAPPMPSGR